MNPNETPVEQPVEPPVPSPQVIELQEDVVVWEASEYLQHNNGLWWWVAFGGVVVVLIAAAVLLHSWTFPFVIIVMAIAAVIHVRRPPRVLHYALGDHGLEIDGKLHSYSEFKSFSVVRDGAFFAVLLIPTRRFLPMTVIYFDEADGEAIVDAFGSRMPMENRGLDTLDRFLRLIRF